MTAARGMVLNKSELFSYSCGVRKEEKKKKTYIGQKQIWGKHANGIMRPCIYSYHTFLLDSFIQLAIFIFQNTTHQNNLRGYRSWLTPYFSVFAFFCHAGHNLVLRELMHLPFQCWQAVFQRNMEFYLFIYLSKEPWRLYSGDFLSCANN